MTVPSAQNAPERAWLVLAPLGDLPRAEVDHSLDELRALADTSGADIVGHTVARLRAIQPATYIGRGKAAQIAEEAQAANANLVIFDEDLSPAQSRSLTDLLGLRIVDRTQLILDIFARRALTLEGRLQIELAQLRYLLPRLRGMWTHLERQQGGIGLTGPGEKQLELDRRRIGQRINRIREQVQQVGRRRGELRRGRRRHGWALLTLVGYTNAGKSTLLNRLASADVLADDQLFATLDPTTRQIELPNKQACLLTDTVGFIRKLPHHLVDAFKATLEEVNEADLLLHVVDASHPRVEEQMAAVAAVLKELDAHEKPMLTVFNKTDSERGRVQAARLAERVTHSVAISATTGAGMEQLTQMITDLLRERVEHIFVKLPASEGRWISAIHANGKVLEQKVRGKHLHIEAIVAASFAAKLDPAWLKDG
ncbi:MAG: GTPase HflX [Kiritimatiellia bacterium]|mgnify:FL=1|jgi:GTP-binding protein HflX|nr:GTPase HflX [Lentisphaerota bacterium]